MLEEFGEEDEQEYNENITKVSLKSIELHADQPSRRAAENIDDLRVRISTILSQYNIFLVMSASIRFLFGFK